MTKQVDTSLAGRTHQAWCPDRRIYRVSCLAAYSLRSRRSSLVSSPSCSRCPVVTANDSYRGGRMMRSRLAFLGFVLALVASASAQDINIQVELAAPLGTDVSHKGDAISARVISPAALRGDVLLGKINESRTGNKLTGTATLSFSFDTLR